MMRPFVAALLLLGAGSVPVTAEPIDLQTTVASAGSTADAPLPTTLADLPANLRLPKATLAEALTRLSESAGVPIAFSPSRVASFIGPLNCPCADVTVGEALDHLLFGTPLRYVDTGSRIVIERSPAVIGTATADVEFASMTLGSGRPIANAARIALAAPHTRPVQTGTITGRVADARTNRPLVSVQVSIEGSGIGTLTDTEGRYRLENVPAGEATVVVQSVGYGTTREPVRVVAGETATRDFQLTERAFDLDAIVVTGTAGQARRREVGNSISQITAEDVREPVVNVDHFLQGRAAGVDVAQTSGGIGAGAQIRLRGNVSVSQTNQPLIYIDGVRIPADEYPRGNSLGDAFHRGPNLTQSPLNDLNPADIERIEVIKGAAAATLYGTEAAAGVIQIFTKRGREGRASWTAQIDQSVNWMQPFGPANDPFIGMSPWLSRAHGQRYSLSAGGGTSDIGYYLSGAFENNRGVLPNDSEERVALRGNIGFSGFDNLRIDWNSAVSLNELFNTSEGNNAHGIQFNVYRMPNNPIGSDVKEDLDAILNQELRTTNNRLTTGLTFNWTPTAAMMHRLTVGYDRLSNHFLHVRPFAFQLQPEGAITDRIWISEGTTLDYVGNLSIGLTPALRTRIGWGGQLQRNAQNDVDAFGRGYPGPGDHVVSNAAVRVAHTNSFEVVTGGLFGQAVFDLLDRYFLTLGLRVDGNSAFGEDLGLQPYPKASFSYVVSDEGFWPEQFGTMKLRAAYGQAGRAPGAFDAARTWQATGYLGVPAFVPENVGNPLLGPERTNELEVGFDAMLLNERLGIDFTFYDQRTSDALFAVAQIPSQGFLGSQLENVGALTNRGVEVSLNASVLERQNFAWRLGTTLATNRSEITETGASTAYSLVVGQPAPVIRGTRVVNAGELAEPIVERDAFFGPNQPTRTIGLSTVFELPRGIELSARGEYQGGHYISDGASYNMVDRGNGAPSCASAYAHVPYGAANPNQQPGMAQVPALERVRCYRQNLLPGSWVYPADFFKLRSLTLSMPVDGLVPGTNSTVVTLSLRNGWRWRNSEFWSFDPEMSARELGSLTRNISEQIPAPATFTASVRIGF
jgi:TonB-dependent starch-binding outer membrane protein SusC